MAYTFKDLSDRKELSPVPNEFLEHYCDGLASGIEGMLVSEKEKDECIKALAEKLTADYKPMLSGTPLIFAPLLNGAMIFATELMQKLPLPIELDTLKLESYGGTMGSTGEIRIHKDFSRSVKGKHVLLLEDIVDSGATIDFVKTMLNYKGAKSVKIATFLDKKSARKVPVEPDYAGFTIPDLFVVGYGLDYKHQLRNLPFIGIYKEK